MPDAKTHVQATPRIALVHALRESMDPCIQAFARDWPEANIVSLLDDSLPQDFADGASASDLNGRFARLTDYAATGMSTDSARVSGILFTCSAFGESIELSKKLVQIPVLSPFEAAFEEAIAMNCSVGLVASFSPALAVLHADFKRIATSMNYKPRVSGISADRALDALKGGHPEEHDQMVAEAATSLKDADVLILCQFSLARATGLTEQATGKKVLSTPASAVRRLRDLTGRFV